MSKANDRKASSNIFSYVVFLMGVLSLLLASRLINAAEQNSMDFFVKINGHIISVEEYGDALQEGVRNRFYHFSVPENERESFEKEIGISLIESYLLDNQSKKLGLHADPSEVSKKLQYLDQKNQKYENWPEHRNEVLKISRTQFEKQSRLEQIENKIREVPEPNERAILAYYKKHPDKFTEPRRSKVSLILLAAIASGGSSEWEKVKQQADKVVFRARNGESFADLANTFSSDPSAERGGDMGYLHKGLLGEIAEEKINELTINEISEPVMLLEGWAVFKLTARDEAHLNTFEDVKVRAAQLLKRDMAEGAWVNYRKKVIKAADIEFSSRFSEQFKDI